MAGMSPDLPPATVSKKRSWPRGSVTQSWAEPGVAAVGGVEQKKMKLL